MSDHDEREARLRELSQQVTAALAQVAEQHEVLTRLSSSVAELTTALAADRPPAWYEPPPAPYREAPALPPLSPKGQAAVASSPARFATRNVSHKVWRWPLIIFGFALVGTGVVAALLGSQATHRVDPFAGIVGAPRAVEPLALLARARSTAPPGTGLTSIEIWNVREDGTVDFTAKGYYPRITYLFSAPPQAKPQVDPSLPLGAHAIDPPTTHASRFEVYPTGPVSGEASTFDDDNESIADPTCSMRDLWAAARAAGAPAGPVIAHLRYRVVKRRFHGEEISRRNLWSFAIDTTPIAFEIVDPGCKLLE